MPHLLREEREKWGIRSTLSYFKRRLHTRRIPV